MTKEWIEWKGGECPVPAGTLVDVKHRDGDWGIAKEANRFNTGRGPGAAVDWDHSDSDGDIIAWRLHQPEQPAWDGNGLPPVGTECEVAKHLHNAGTKVRVLCHDEGAAVCRVIDGDDLHDLCQLEAFEISPIRTEAERKREEILKELRSHVTNFNKTDVLHAIEEVYDAIAAGNIRGVKLDS